jgi:glycosyltransferase involved in cell wall biosynthesis
MASPTRTEGHPCVATAEPVLQLISTGGLYGAERVLLELARFLSERGWAPHVGVLSSPGAPALIAQASGHGLPTVVVPGRPGHAARARRQLRHYLARHRIRLLHSHGYKADLYSLLAAPAGVARVSTCHNWLRQSAKMRLYEWLDKGALRRFDHVAVVSDRLLEDVRRAGLSPRRTSFVENGISLDRPDAAARGRTRAEFGLEPHQKMLLRVGSLTRCKGNDTLIDAFRRVGAGAPAVLVFAGEGEEQPALAARARALGVQARVRFAGYRPDMPALLAAADLCVISSHNEGLPLVLLEAMAAGVPVVSTDVGAIARAIQQGDSGWLVPAGDADALGAALREALRQPDRAAQMARRARHEYERRYSRAAMGERYLRIYHSLIGQPAPGSLPARPAAVRG